MILPDTHIGVWYVDENPRLSEEHRRLISESEQDGLGVSAISQCHYSERGCQP